MRKIESKKRLLENSTTLEVQQDLHRYLKKIADQQGMLLKDFIDKLLKNASDYNEKDQRQTTLKIRKKVAPVELDFAATKKTKKSAVSFSSEVVTMLAVAGLIAIIAGVLLTGEFILTVYQN